MGNIQIFPDDRHFELTFLTLQESFFITVSPNNLFLDELTSLFVAKTDDQEGTRIIEALQQCTTEFLFNLQQFVALHKQELPALNQVQQFFKKLIPNSFFIIVYGKIDDTSIHFDYYRHLHHLHLQNELPVKYAPDSFNFGPILSVYNMHFFGHQRRTIGVSARENVFVDFARENRARSISLASSCHSEIKHMLTLKHWGIS